MRKEEFNIYEFHQKIKRINEEYSETELLEKQYVIEQKLLNEYIENYTVEMNIKKEYQEIQHKLNHIQEYNTYHTVAESIITEYNKLLNCTIKNSFMKKPKHTVEENVLKKKEELKFPSFPLFFPPLKMGTTFHGSHRTSITNPLIQ